MLVRNRNGWDESFVNFAKDYDTVAVLAAYAAARPQ